MASSMSLSSRYQGLRFPPRDPDTDDVAFGKNQTREVRNRRHQRLAHVPQEREMRNPPAHNEQIGSFRDSRYRSDPNGERNPVHVNCEEEGDDRLEPNDLSETNRIRSKGIRKGFLPIAMPRPDGHPSDFDHEEHTDYERRSEFNAPDHIEVAASGSFGEDGRTHVSELSHPTYAVPKKRLNGNGSTPYSQQGRRAFVNHLENLEEVSREDSSYQQGSEERPIRSMGVDVTDLDNIHEAVGRVRKNMKNKKKQSSLRHGLPYEDTDYRADDDASLDSWGQAIVGGEGQGGEYILGSQTFQSRASDVSDLIKETLSEEGALLIDLSAIEDEESAIEELRKCPKRTRSLTKQTQTTQDLDDPEGLESTSNQEQRQAPTELTREGQQARKSEQAGSSLPHQAAISSQMPQMQEGPFLPSQVRVGIPTGSSSTSSAKEFLSTSLVYLKIIADGIGEQIDKINLIPEEEMDNLLGVLKKDLAATSQNVPEQKEVVDYLEKQIKKTACVVDSTVGGGTKGSMFDSSTFDRVVENTKKNYAMSALTCCIDPKERQAHQLPNPPQTFMVPITMYAAANSRKALKQDE